MINTTKTMLLLLIIKMLYRIYWLITQAPGVARYTSDIILFSNAYMLTDISDDEKDIVKRTMQGYIDAEKKRNKK